MHQSLVSVEEAVMEQIRMASARMVDPAPAGKPAARSGTFVLHGDYWTIGYGGDSFSLRNVLGLSYIQLLLQHPAEAIHAFDLLTSAGAGTGTTDALAASLRNDEGLIPGRPGDAGPR